MPRVVILADDLIWADRLVGSARAAGAEPRSVRSIEGFESALATTDAAIVDLTARSYDGIAAIGIATRHGMRCLAVGQHDDHAMRKQALAAGAERVLAYRKLFEDGPATIERWLGRSAAVGS